MRAPLIRVLTTTLLLAACRSSEPPSAADVERDLQSSAQTTVREEAFTLYSPYADEPTSEYAAAVRADVALVRPLFADAGSTPVRLYLLPLPKEETDDDLEPWEHASREGIGGGASSSGFAYLFVRGDVDASTLMMQAVLGRAAMRHELAHLYARRAGLARAAWFREGLAREVEWMRVADSVLRENAFPRALIAARTSARPGSIDVLLDWEPGDELTPAEREQRYDHAQALFRFLLERETGSSWIERARAVHARTDAEIQALEPRWLAWLAELDALAAIRARMDTATESERTELATLLPILAERGAAELLTRAADELALALLADPACQTSAATFLLFFRARALTEADVDALSRASEPVAILTACALRARRGEPVDLEQARAAWSRVPEDQRPRFSVQSALLPDL